MSLSPELVSEINVLRTFDVSGTQIGIKVHSDAAPETIAAAQRLYEKQLITQPDGGYLTTLGYEAAVQVQQALHILTSPVSV